MEDEFSPIQLDLILTRFEDYLRWKLHLEVPLDSPYYEQSRNVETQLTQEEVDEQKIFLEIGIMPEERLFGPVPPISPICAIYFDSSFWTEGQFDDTRFATLTISISTFFDTDGQDTTDLDIFKGQNQINNALSINPRLQIEGPETAIFDRMLPEQDNMTRSYFDPNASDGVGLKYTGNGIKSLYRFVYIDSWLSEGEKRGT